jgi:hypothetical protein
MASEVKANKLSPSSGTALQIGDASDTITIPTGATFTITDGLGVAAGGTGLSSFTAGDVLYATGSTTLAKLAKGTAEQVLAMNSGATAPDWGSVDLTVLPTITVAKGGTNLTSFTAGDVLYATGSTTLAKLAKGSAADVLTMNSGATAPEWAAAAGGGAWTLISTTTASADATIDFTTFSTDYTDFMLIGTGVTAATNVSFPRMRYYVGGSIVTASDYMWSARAYDLENTGGQSMDGGQYNATYIMMADPYDASAPTALGNTAGYNMNFTFYVSDVHSTTLWKNAWFWDTLVLGGSVPSQGQTANYFGGGLYESTSALTGIQFYLSAGNVALGRFSLYGRKLT